MAIGPSTPERPARHPHRAGLAAIWYERMGISSDGEDQISKKLYVVGTNERRWSFRFLGSLQSSPPFFCPGRRVIVWRMIVAIR